MINENTLEIKRLMYTKFQRFIWAYTIENIKLYFDQRTMTMNTEVVKKSSFFPPFLDGIEHISYKAFSENPFSTLYSKSL